MLMDRLKAEAARADRMQRPLTVAIVDIDHFKAINDAHGHDAGDNVLVEIAGAIQSSVREYDVCGRWGGEEFLIIMPEIDAASGAAVVERVRSAVRTLCVAIGTSQVTLSASFGVAERLADESVSQLISRADAALFTAKRAGRDRIETAV
jgi:diguanylate cyclase (GGDEF)-like protein